MIIMALSRTQFFSSSHFSKLFIPKTCRLSLNKDLINRSYYTNSKSTTKKNNVKLISHCLSVGHSCRYAKVIVFREKHYGLVFEYFRNFHTSDRRYLHPIIWAALRPALKFLAIITGRSFRKWWRDLPPNKKKYFIEVIKENRNSIAIFVLTSIILSLIYYVSHIEETPVTKRRRFMAFNTKQLEKINQIEFQKIMEQFQNLILPANDPETIRVRAVVNRLLAANQDVEGVKDKKWGIAVINSPSVENAFVLPIGYVFVFTGMLSLCTNDDELGTVLAHEMAHCIQNHGAEKVSLGHLLDLISIGIIAAIWAIVPSDSISLFTHWLYNKLLKLFFELPYDRKIETEADIVGLQLAAKACFDVRASSAFWAKMALIHDSIDKIPAVEFLSTHPSHEKRSEYLDSLMDEALKLRHNCGCPRVRSVDPRLNTEVIAKALEATRRKYLEKHPKQVIVFHL